MHRLTALLAAQQRRAAALPPRTTATTPPSRPSVPFPETRRCSRRPSPIARARRRDDDSAPEQRAATNKRRRTPNKSRDAANDADAADANDDANDATTTTAALRRAVRLVDYRERSSGELLRRLRESSFPEPVARATVERLETSGLVDDRRFAELLVARRWQLRAEAPRAIRQALLAAGVPREVGEEALTAFFGGDVRVVKPYVDEDDEEANDDGGAGARWRALVAAAKEQARRSESVGCPEKRRARLARWLAARGHSWDTVSALVREVGL